MFFHIGPNNTLLKNKITDTLYLDDGWTEYNGAWYKGYSLDGVLSESIDPILDGTQPNGIWCVIKDGKVYHPKLRGFPIYTNGVFQTNLPHLDRDPAFTMIVQESPYSEVNRDTLITLDEAARKVADILVENSMNFVKFNPSHQVSVLFSAGMDSTTTWAAFTKASSNYTLDVKNPTNFVRSYTSELINYLGIHWGYKMTSVFDKSCYTTGFYSEGIQFREVEMALLVADYLAAQGKDTALHTDDYLYHFMRRDDIVSRSKHARPVVSTEHELFTTLLQMTIYDYQMWHLDNNIHFSPFYDLRIPEVMTHLSVDDLYENCKTAIVQKKVIALLEPQLIDLVSTYKNSGDVFENYRKNFGKIVLPSTVTVKR
jgi:hypothetical protein